MRAPRLERAATAAVDSHVVSGLARAIRGRILLPADEAYDDARRVYNGGIDRRPALIVRCASTEDVVAALRVAREHDLIVAVRGGGHSAAGFGVCDGGMVIDLSDMTSVRVDAEQRVAVVDGGATWRHVDAGTHADGLATTGGRISSVGVAGSTLGGGYGWLMRRRGLAIDNLIAATLVTADGRVRQTSTDEHPDLFWALRGGGGNFGIVTSLVFRLHPIAPMVTGGMAFYAIDRIRELLEWYRTFMATASDDLSALFNVLIAPPAPFVPASLRGVPVVAIPVCHVGTLDAAERELSPLRRLGPVLDRIGPMPYPRLQRLFDAAGAFGYRTFGRSGHLRRLDDRVIAAVAARAPGVTSPFSIVMISALGGAVGRVDERATAFGYRATAFDCAINAVWMGADADPHVRWANALWDDIRPSTSGVYVNELGDEGQARVREAYPSATYARLARLKAAHDPDNVFRLNHNLRANEAASQEPGPC